eukprot:CAMPEP_0180033696 /NCGR_PEP_ID=MMETSP0984-20121128/29180_1 /TAXON_ID=483367 /ORGANISM="non described non described, Strain CCMP 2436" /LENGTH=121 /DNA_ID=CAMNT_0021959119 /DNA_START=155 /DNA_END=518 /DNA_ORIENTATION=+
MRKEQHHLVDRRAEGERAQVYRSDHDAQLLADLAREGLLARLARLDFAAGELPHPREAFAVRALCDEDARVVGHETRSDDELQRRARVGRGHAGQRRAARPLGKTRARAGRGHADQRRAVK